MSPLKDSTALLVAAVVATIRRTTPATAAVVVGAAATSDAEGAAGGGGGGGRCSGGGGGGGDGGNDSSEGDAEVVPALEAQLFLDQDLEALRLFSSGHQKSVPLKKVTRVFAGLHVGMVLEEAVESTNAAFRSATLELDMGRAVSFMFEDEMVRDEFVWCILVLADAARGRSLRLCSTTREEEEEDDDDEDDEDEDEDKNGVKSSIPETSKEDMGVSGGGSSSEHNSS
mmetsp:Transcript_43487/g.109209  ORF Transcript_43487/g.109209 Transcript_43487/m.109209 type:complete len:228 (+) Transcript_43487:132-815(+)